MDASAIKALMAEIAPVIREYVAGETAPLIERNAALETENRTLGERIAVLEAREQPEAIKGDPGVVDMEAVGLLIHASVAEALAAVPIPRDGVDGKDGEPGQAGQDGVDGKDADPAMVAAAVEDAVANAVAALPAPEKGERGEKGEAGERGNDGQPGERGADGKDGVGLAGMMIDRAGEAVATLTDGTLVKLGPVVGRDGADGAAGEPGNDGRDGQDLTDIEVVQDGAKLELAFQIGETRSVYEVVLPAGPAGADGVDAYAGEARGLYDSAQSYRKMDAVSFNGSEWRAKQDDPGELPGPGWMLSASKGKRGDRGERGAPGADGVSLVAQYIRGDELVTTLSDGAEFRVSLADVVAA